MLIRILLSVNSKYTSQLLLFSLSCYAGDDLVISYKGNNVSTISILQRLNITGNFRFGAFCPRDEHSCQTRCIKGAVGGLTERQQNLPCYCDSHCLDVGDCCYDFFARYVHTKSAEFLSWVPYILIHLSIRVCLYTTAVVK